MIPLWRGAKNDTFKQPTGICQNMDSCGVYNLRYLSLATTTRLSHI